MDVTLEASQTISAVFSPKVKVYVPAVKVDAWVVNTTEPSSFFSALERVLAALPSFKL